MRGRTLCGALIDVNRLLVLTSVCVAALHNAP
jgi:hypothetical protein